jgi:glycosyl hydrolase family 59 (putative galactocerebrosidase)
MHGSRPDLFQLRQLILAAVIITGAVAIIAGVTMCSGSDGFSQSAATAINFAKMEIGSPPTGFLFARTGQGSLGRWVVVSDESSFAGRAIEQSSPDRTDYRFPLAILNTVVAKNVDVSLKFKPVAGRVDQAGGIAVRVLDGDNYYVVRANALENNVRFYRVVKGRRQQIDGVNTKVSSGEWHSLGLKAQEDQFTIEFDGKTLFTTSDKTFAGAGKIALWTKSDSITRFDQISIVVLP